MEEVYIDLSDKIFIHKDFIEVNWRGYTNKKVWLKFIDGFIDLKIPFKVSEWNGDKLEEVLLEHFDLRLLIMSKRIVRFG